MANIQEQKKELLALAKDYLFQSYPHLRPIKNAGPAKDYAAPIPFCPPPAEKKLLRHDSCPKAPTREIEEGRERAKTPPQEKEQERRRNTSSFFDQLKERFSQALPHIRLIADIPSDEEARLKRAGRPESFWGYQALILHECEKADSYTLMKNFCAAIVQGGVPGACVFAPRMETTNSWGKLLQSPCLRLVMASNELVGQCPKLAACINGASIENACFLTIPPFAHLAKESALKKPLWDAVRAQLNF